jgi:aerobic carbon-monoxide dehydrogenase small subunit
MGRTVPVRFHVNGVERGLEVEPRMSLVHALRDRLGLTGTHVGCDTSQLRCVHRSSGRSGGEVAHGPGGPGGRRRGDDDRGVGVGRRLHPVQEAFWNDHGLQCGYCTPGTIMAAAALLAENPSPTEDQVRGALEGNRCRCTGYHNIVKAVLDAAKVKGATIVAEVTA